METKSRKFNSGDFVLVRDDIGRSSDGILLYENPELKDIPNGDPLDPNGYTVVKHNEPLLVLEPGSTNEFGERSVKVLHFTKVGWVPSFYLRKITQ